MHRIVHAAAAAMFASAAGAEVPVVPFGNDDINVVEISLDKRSAILVGVVLRNVGGKLAVCGASFPSKGSGSKQRAAKYGILRDMIIEIRGKPVQVNTNVFLDYENEAEATHAGCSVTNRPWVAGYARDKVHFRPRTGLIDY